MSFAVHTRARLLPVIAGSLVALVAAGCGNDEDGGQPLSESELVAEANAICTRHTETISAAANELIAGGELPTPKTLGELAQGTIVPELTAQIEELRALDAPDEVADGYEAWIDDSESLLDTIKQDPPAIANPTTFESVNRQADELGLASDCQAGPS